MNLKESFVVVVFFFLYFWNDNFSLLKLVWLPKRKTINESATLPAGGNLFLLPLTVEVKRLFLEILAKCLPGGFYTVFQSGDSKIWEVPKQITYTYVGPSKNYE